MDSQGKYVPEQVAEQLGNFFQNGFDSLYERGSALQYEVLDEIIGLVAQSNYAKDHGFAGISSREDFLSRVPISEYADYAPYIEENMERDAEQLIALDTEYYLVSTGRKGQQGKYYSESRLGALARETVINIYQMGIARNEPLLMSPDFKTMPVLNTAPFDAAPNGKPVRRASAQSAKGIWERGGDTLIYPIEFLEAEMSEEDRTYLLALYAVKEKNLTQINCNNLAAFGDILDCATARAEQIIDDIRTGHLSANLSEEDRSILEELFEADPERADNLAKLLTTDEGFIPEAIWPHFILATGWIGGSVGAYSKDIMARLSPKMRYYNTPYGCTEAMIAATIAHNSSAGPLATYSCFFEFLPLGKDEPVVMDKVEVGGYYELILTTYSGLLRYNLHDVIMVKGFEGTTPIVEFCGRSAELFETESGALPGYRLREIIEGIQTQDSGILSLFQGVVCEGALSLILEFYKDPNDMKAYAERLRSVLSTEGILVGHIYVVESGFRHNLYRSLLYPGQNVQSLKLSMIAESIPDGNNVRFVL